MIRWSPIRRRPALGGDVRMHSLALSKVSLLLPLFSLGLAPLASGQEGEVPLPPISTRRLMAHIEFLASEELQGREAGSNAERVAAQYVATRLEAASVPPLSEVGRFQEFALQRMVRIEILDALSPLRDVRPIQEPRRNAPGRIGEARHDTCGRTT